MLEASFYLLNASLNPASEGSNLGAEFEESERGAVLERKLEAQRERLNKVNCIVLLATALLLMLARFVSVSVYLHCGHIEGPTQRNRVQQFTINIVNINQLVFVR